MRSLLEISSDVRALATEIAKDHATSPDSFTKDQAERISSDLLKAYGRCRTAHFKLHPRKIEGVA